MLAKIDFSARTAYFENEVGPGVLHFSPALNKNIPCKYSRQQGQSGNKIML